MKTKLLFILFSFFSSVFFIKAQIIFSKDYDLNNLKDSTIAFYSKEGLSVSKEAFINLWNSSKKLDARAELNENRKVVSVKLVNLRSTIKVKEIAPDFLQKDLAGNIVSSSNFIGKVIVLNFWATWCKPCVAEIPMLNKLKLDFKADTNVVFIAPAYDKDSVLFKFQETHNYLFTILPAAYNIINAYNVTVYPANIIIDKKGLIYFVETGSIRNTNALRRKIKRLLKAAPSKNRVIIE